jgi:hypothetical protein
MTVKVAHVRVCHSRMMFVRAYPRETQEMVTRTSVPARDRPGSRPAPSPIQRPACRQPDQPNGDCTFAGTAGSFADPLPTKIVSTAVLMLS